MTKLLKVLLNNIKKELLIILAIPMVLSLFSVLFNLLDKQILGQIFFGLTFMGGLLSYGAIFLYSISKDYNTFFGEGASFYSALPAAPKDVVLARYLYYLIIGLCSIIVTGLFQALSAFVLLISSQSNYMVLKEFKESFKILTQYMGQLPLIFYAIILLAFLVHTFYSIGQIVFSTTYGSEKKFRKFGIGGPIIVFIVTNILVSIISLIGEFLLPFSFELTQSATGGYTFELVRRSMMNLQSFFQESATNPNLIPMGSLIISLIVSIFFFYRSYKSHNEKLSVN